MSVHVAVVLWGPFAYHASITCSGTPYWSGSILANGDGTYTTAPFVHDHWEEVYLVQGDLVVGNDKQGKGGQQCFAPTYACRPPGVHHGPFTSRGGCILHEIHYYA